MANRKRVCLLTGASGRLGTAFCNQFASRYDIAAVYHNTLPWVASQERKPIDPLEPERDLPENEHPVHAIQADLSDPKNIARVVEVTLAKFGAIDLLINGAAIYTQQSLMKENAAGECERQLHLNVTVPLLVAQEAVRQFWRYEFPANKTMNRNIVNVSSISGVEVYPRIGQGIYSASKAALNHLTPHMAAEFAEWNIRVNALAPTSFPGLITPESVAQAIAKLDNGEMNGAVLVMDKGKDYYLNADE